MLYKASKDLSCVLMVISKLRAAEGMDPGVDTVLNAEILVTPSFKSL